MMGIMAPVEWALHFNCRNFMRLASARGDRPLSPTEKLMFHAHRWLCGVCRRQEKRLRQLHTLVHASAQASTNDPAIRLGDEARANLQTRLARELAGETDNPPSSPEHH